MYAPRHFLESDVATLHAAIRATGLATMVSLTADGLFGTHLPLLLDPEPAPYGTLIGHVARANPHARLADPSVQTMVIFQGAEGYITPSWYEAKAETGKVVPTWNYSAIHAHGPLEAFDDPARLLDVVTRLTDRHEGERERPWAVSDAPADFINGMLKGIVGIAIPILRLEGKVKLSQNRPPVDQQRVIAGLRADGRDDLADAMARVVQSP